MRHAGKYHEQPTAAAHINFRNARRASTAGDLLAPLGYAAVSVLGEVPHRRGSRVLFLNPTLLLPVNAHRDLPAAFTVFSCTVMRRLHVGGPSVRHQRFSAGLAVNGCRASPLSPVLLSIRSSLFFLFLWVLFAGRSSRFQCERPSFAFFCSRVQRRCGHARFCGGGLRYPYDTKRQLFPSAIIRSGEVGSTGRKHIHSSKGRRRPPAARPRVGFTAGRGREKRKCTERGRTTPTRDCFPPRPASSANIGRC